MRRLLLLRLAARVCSCTFFHTSCDLPSQQCVQRGIFNVWGVNLLFAMCVGAAISAASFAAAAA